MKKWAFNLIAAALLVAGTYYVSAQPQDAPKPEKKMIVGEVIDIAGFVMKGAIGEEHADAIKFRTEGGFPVGILDEESGEIYIAVYKNPAPASVLETANKVMAEYAGMKVAAQGLVYRSHGMNVIRIAIIGEY